GTLGYTIGGGDLDSHKAPGAVAQDMLAARRQACGRRLLNAPAEARGQPPREEIGLAVVGGGVLVACGVLDSQLLDACEVGAHVGCVKELRDDLAPGPLRCPARITDSAASALTALEVVERGKTALDMRHLGGVHDKSVASVYEVFHQL